jgi:rhodanese-related sulfurtransferase
MAAKQHSPRFLAIVEDSKARVREMSVDELRQKRAAGDPFVLVDVREDNEWAAAHAAGAVHIGKGVIERDIESKVPDEDAEVVLYCGGGFRSALAADALQKMGYRKVWSLAGGWRAYTEAGLPVEK